MHYVDAYRANVRHFEIIFPEDKDKRQQELFEILSDHQMYCEEDSWFKNQDLEQWTLEQMEEYYNKYVPQPKEENTMNDFKEQLEQLLIAHMDSATIPEEVCMALNKAKDFEELEQLAIAYHDAGTLAEQQGMNILDKLDVFNKASREEMEELIQEYTGEETKDRIKGMSDEEVRKAFIEIEGPSITGKRA